MKKFLILFFTCTFFSSIFLFDQIVLAGECTPGDVIKMIDAGLRADKIEILCKETLFPKDPMCCCETKQFQFNQEPIPGSKDPYTGEQVMKETLLEVFKKLYWIKASTCLSKAKSNSYDKIVAECINSSRCGK